MHTIGHLSSLANKTIESDFGANLVLVKTDSMSWARHLLLRLRSGSASSLSMVDSAEQSVAAAEQALSAEKHADAASAAAEATPATATAAPRSGVRGRIGAQL